MAKCVVENCEHDGGRVNINLSTETVRYNADVSLCVPCWEKMRDAKRDGTNHYDVELIPSPNPFWTETAVDYRGVRKRAEVKAIRIQ